MAENLQAGTNEKRSGLHLPSRQIISYFDHEFMPLSLPQIEHDMAEIVDMHFTNVVLCVTEKDIASKSRMRFIKNTVEVIEGNGLEVWADPWSVGSVFGGEGGSPFKDSGEKSCMCNPKLDSLINRWMDGVKESSIQSVFWDEPEMKCDEHRHHELPFVEKYTARAGQLALSSVVCLTANESKKQQLVEVANMPDVVEIATDPYFPNAFQKITEKERISYVGQWTDYISQVAEVAGVRSHVWAQLFDVPDDRISMVEEHIDVIRNRFMADIALWGYRGCASVPDFIHTGQASSEVVWQAAKRALSRHV